MKNSIVFSVFSVALAGFLINAIAQPQSVRSDRPKWEYKVILLTSDFKADLRELNVLGSDGWELIDTGISRAIFKKTVQ